MAIIVGYINFDKSGENKDIFLRLKSIDDFLSHATANMESIAEDSTPLEVASVNVPITNNAGLPNPVLSSIDASTCRQQSEEMEELDTQVLSELATRFGRRIGKFQPKPKIQMQNKIHKASTTNGTSESTSCLQDSQSVPAFPQDDVLDLSAVGYTHAIPTESMPECIVNEDLIDLVGTSQLDSGFDGEHPERHVWTGKSKTRASVSSSEHQIAPTSGQENEASRSLRPRKNKRNVFRLVDEFDDEVLGDGKFPAECPNSSFVGENNIAGKEFQVENESQTKKAKRNSLKPIGDKEKPAGKPKEAKETSDQAAKPKPNKFSHSTLKRRRVDKVLLETPKDEIDFQKVLIRDLILLAEHKEQLKKKEATTRVHSTNQSNGNPSENYNEDEPFAFEQDGEYDHGRESPRVEESKHRQLSNSHGQDSQSKMVKTGHRVVLRGHTAVWDRLFYDTTTFSWSYTPPN